MSDKEKYFCEMCRTPMKNHITNGIDCLIAQNNNLRNQLEKLQATVDKLEKQCKKFQEQAFWK